MQQRSEVRGQRPDNAAIAAARMFVVGELAEVSLSAAISKATRDADALLLCSICEKAKPASSFRDVVGRTTTRACGDCCDARESLQRPTLDSQLPMSRRDVAAFCLRLAHKRHARYTRTAARLNLQPASIGGASCDLADGPKPSAVFSVTGKTALGSNFPCEKGKSALATSAEQYAARLGKLPDRIAAIVGKTFAVLGDGYQLADDEALMMIRDELEALDETVITRNQNKKLARKKPN